MERCAILLAGILPCCSYQMELGNGSILPADSRNKIHSSVLVGIDSPDNSLNWTSRSDSNTDKISSERNTGQMFPYNYWPNNGKCIPFKLHAAFENHPENRRKILYALRTIERRTNSCVTFKTWSTEPEFISISPARSDSCGADVGRTPGKVTRVILSKECLKQGVILHEMLHALGFFHEHSRPDRDDYLRIFPEHVKAGYLDPNFVILANMSNHGLQYDFESIMHFHPFAFARSLEKPTIVPKIPLTITMGQLEYLSVLDVSKINRAYGCVDRYFNPLPQTTPTNCTVELYLNVPAETTTNLSPGDAFAMPLPSICQGSPPINISCSSSGILLSETDFLISDATTMLFHSDEAHRCDRILHEFHHKIMELGGYAEPQISQPNRTIVSQCSDGRAHLNHLDPESSNANQLVVRTDLSEKCLSDFAAFKEYVQEILSDYNTSTGHLDDSDTICNGFSENRLVVNCTSGRTFTDTNPSVAYLTSVVLHVDASLFCRRIFAAAYLNLTAAHNVVIDNRHHSDHVVAVCRRGQLMITEIDPDTSTKDIVALYSGVSKRCRDTLNNFIGFLLPSRERKLDRDQV